MATEVTRHIRLALDLHSESLQFIEKGYGTMNVDKGMAIVWMLDFSNLSLKKKEEIHKTLIEKYDACLKACELTRNLPDYLKRVAGGDEEAITYASNFCRAYSVLSKQKAGSSEEEPLELEPDEALELAKAHLAHLTNRIETVWKPLMEQRLGEFSATLDPLFAKIRNDRGIGSALYGALFTNHYSLNAAHREFVEGKSFTLGSEDEKRVEREKESKLDKALQMLTPAASESSPSPSVAECPNQEAGAYQSEVLTQVVQTLLTSMSRLGSGASYLMEQLLEEKASTESEKAEVAQLETQNV